MCKDLSLPYLAAGSDVKNVWDLRRNKKNTSIDNFFYSYKPRGASPLRHFFAMFLVKGAERRGQWITGAQKDLTLHWLRIY
jgi:hypothetical protein